MLLWLLFLFNISQVQASDKYKEAIHTASEAALKQSGLESDFIKITKASEKETKLWMRKQGLEPVATLLMFAVPIVYNKKVRLKSGNIILIGSEHKVEATWTLQF